MIIEFFCTYNSYEVHYPIYVQIHYCCIWKSRLISKQIIKSSNFRISFKDASLSHWDTIATFLHGQKNQTFFTSSAYNIFLILIACIQIGYIVFRLGFDFWQYWFICFWKGWQKVNKNMNTMPYLKLPKAFQKEMQLQKTRDTDILY